MNNQKPKLSFPLKQTMNNGMQVVQLTVYSDLSVNFLIDKIHSETFQKWNNSSIKTLIANMDKMGYSTDYFKQLLTRVNDKLVRSLIILNRIC